MEPCWTPGTTHIQPICSSQYHLLEGKLSSVPSSTMQSSTTGKDPIHRRQDGKTSSRSTIVLQKHVRCDVYGRKTELTPPATGIAAAISAMLSDTIVESPPTMVQLAKAGVGPPVYIIHPKRTGMPLMKFMDCRSRQQPMIDTDLEVAITENVAAHDSNRPRCL